MRIKVIYDVSAEEFEKIMSNPNVIKAEVILKNGNGYEELDDAIEKWLAEHDIDGYAISYARDLFCSSDYGRKFASISSKRFAKTVRNTGKYTSKNVRIGNAVQYVFVALSR